MVGKDVQIIEYSRPVDRANTVTHLIGAVLSVIGTVLLVKASANTREALCGIIYGLTLVIVYTASTVYHGLPVGEKKRIARLIDHSAVPLLIAGTATPCAMISLYRVSPAHGITVFICGWACALFGIFSKLFFFERLKTVTMTVYIVCGSLMLISAVPRLGELDAGGFWWLVAGCAAYLIGALLCGLGAKREWLHAVFHVFVMLGSGLHFYAIYAFIIK